MRLVLLLLLVTTLAFAQELPSQPELDLPVSPANYEPGAPGVRVPDESSDPRDEPTPTFYGEEIEASNDGLIYVIDFSCSMEVEGRLKKAKAEFARSVSGLPSTMRFGVVLYSCEILAWPVQQATELSKTEAIAFVNAWYPNGGTATGPATARALMLDREVMTVVLLTDGEPNCGADGTDGHRTMIRNSNMQHAAVHVFGIAATARWREFCIEVARDSGGSYTDVP